MYTTLVFINDSNQNNKFIDIAKKVIDNNTLFLNDKNEIEYYIVSTSATILYDDEKGIEERIFFNYLTNNNFYTVPQK